MYPVIEQMKIDKPFKYLWLKYITGIDVSVHCAKTFKGEYSKKVNKEPLQENISLDEVDLSKCRYQFYYLCGVSTPYVYQSNVHVAFMYKEGSTVHLNQNGIEIKIKDACQLNITPEDIDKAMKESRLKTYYTCRNWQFAHTIRRILLGEIQPTDREVQ